jgi:hypothetical protein
MDDLYAWKAFGSNLLFLYDLIAMVILSIILLCRPSRRRVYYSSASVRVLTNTFRFFSLLHLPLFLSSVVQYGFNFPHSYTRYYTRPNMAICMILGWQAELGV